MKILNLTRRVATKHEMPWSESTFPDSQPHFALKEKLNPSDHVEIVACIRSPLDLVRCGMAVEVVARAVPFGVLGLNLSYLMGARMDRPIDEFQPFTLEVVSGMISSFSGQCDYVRILDPHSPRSTSHLLGAGRTVDNTKAGAILPVELVYQAAQNEAYLAKKEGRCFFYVSPDAGAGARNGALISAVAHAGGPADFLHQECRKKRDPQTGALSGFVLAAPHDELHGASCLIVDDLCDGGGTFVGVAKLLREAGAHTVALCVTHGLFTKGWDLPGIDRIYTTDSVGSQPIVTDRSKVQVMQDYLVNFVRGHYA